MFVFVRSARVALCTSWNSWTRRWHATRPKGTCWERTSTCSARSSVLSRACRLCKCRVRCMPTGVCCSDVQCLWSQFGFRKHDIRWFPGSYHEWHTAGGNWLLELMWKIIIKLVCMCLSLKQAVSRQWQWYDTPSPLPHWWWLQSFLVIQWWQAACDFLFMFNSNRGSLTWF